MTTGILTSDTKNFYKKRNLVVMLFILVTACSPTSEKQMSVTKDEALISTGMAILTNPEMTDKSEALVAFEQACSLGNYYGCHEVGTAYNNGLYGKEKNYELARQWYEKGANNGYVPSQLNIANLFAHRLLPLDDETGFSWLVKAGEGIVKCPPDSIEAQANTSETERKRLCKLASFNYKKLFSIFRKRMAAEDMERIEKSILKENTQFSGKNLRAE